VRITTRLPVLRSFELGCPVCGRGNRAEAKFCQACGALLGGPAPEKIGTVTPMPLRFRIAARTDQGRVRKNNQDSLYTGTIKLPSGTARLALVADGMGGARAGEQASRIASEVAQAQLQSAYTAPRRSTTPRGRSCCAQLPAPPTAASTRNRAPTPSARAWAPR